MIRVSTFRHWRTVLALAMAAITTAAIVTTDHVRGSEHSVTLTRVAYETAATVTGGLDGGGGNGDNSGGTGDNGGPTGDNNSGGSGNAGEKGNGNGIGGGEGGASDGESGGSVDNSGGGGGADFDTSVKLTCARYTGAGLVNWDIVVQLNPDGTAASAAVLGDAYLTGVQLADVERTDPSQITIGDGGRSLHFHGSGLVRTIFAGSNVTFSGLPTTCDADFTFPHPTSPVINPSPWSFD